MELLRTIPAGIDPEPEKPADSQTTETDVTDDTMSIKENPIPGDSKPDTEMNNDVVNNRTCRYSGERSYLF